MIAALLLASAPVATAIDAEIAFARDAKRIGQWSAFRKWADRDAVMFTPQAVWVQHFLKDRKDPPKAVKWAPSESFVSCDGRTAVNTGPWWGADGVHHGYFTTVWQRTKAGWRWVYDGGAATTEGFATPSKVPLKVHTASCRTKAPGTPIPRPPRLTPEEARTTPQDDGRGQSADKSLGWDWKVSADGARTFRLLLWKGSRYAEVLTNKIPAPPTK